MRRFNYRMLLAASAAAFVGLMVFADQAQAGWGRWGSSGGSWGSSGGSSGSSGGSWGGSSGGVWVSGSSGSSGGSWGSSGGSWGGYRVRHHRRYGSSGSSGGNWGSSGGSSGGNWGSSGSSGGSWGGSYSIDDDGDTYSPAKPVTPPPPAPSGDVTPPPPAAGDANKATYFGQPDSVMISVSLPEGAKLFVNGNATRSMGTDRTFVSRGLEAGKRYKYELRAEGEKDGKQISESKVVYVTAGDQTNLVFSLDANKAENIAVGTPAETTPAKPVSAKATEDKTTTLRLHVPADAQVTLSGAATKSTGPVRIFSTSKLEDGQSWDNYVVRADVNQNGKIVSRETTISLKAGETRDLTLDFDGPEMTAVASATAR